MIWGVLHADPAQQGSQLVICVSVNNWVSNFICNKAAFENTLLYPIKSFLKLTLL